MNIYFAGSIRAGRTDRKVYHELISFLKKYGTVLTEHVGAEDPVNEPGVQLNDNEIHDRDMFWLTSADAMVAEVTIPSLGVGYEIGRAIEQNIPVLCLFRSGTGIRLSAMISGSPYVNTIEYFTIQEAFESIRLFFKNCLVKK